MGASGSTAHGISSLPAGPYLTLGCCLLTCCSGFQVRCALGPGFITASVSSTSSGVPLTLPACLLCSALAVLASGSGVSTERESFMGLVKNEIDRLNEDMGGRGSVSMVFHAGGVKVGCLAGLQRSLQAAGSNLLDS